jgi:mRNA-degrading endonuclease RelE of RelBE toxin-antitoxin system
VRYKIEYSPDAETHMRELTARQRVIVLAGVERRLNHEPTRETRNRKRMRPNPLAPWELRLGALRVYYDVTVETLALSNDPRFIALIEQSRKRHERQGGISTSEMRRRLGIQQPPRKTAARSKRRMADVSKTSRTSSS